jgi:hypothetical protein
LVAVACQPLATAAHLIAVTIGFLPPSPLMILQPSPTVLSSDVIYGSLATVAYAYFAV